MTLRRTCLAGWLALLLVGLPSQALAGGAPVENNIQSATHAAAVRLAKLVAPPLDVSVEIAHRAFEKGFENKEGKETEARYPGLAKSLWAALEPEFRVAAMRDQANYEIEVAKLYARALSLAEIEAFARFYQTPTGQKLLRAMFQVSNFDPMLAEMAQKEAVSESSVLAVREKGTNQLLSSLSAEDTAALTDLAKAMSLAKMNAVGREVQKLTLEWANKADPELDERVGKIAELFVSKYMDEHPPKD